jgi:hypothetical protein
MSVQGKQAPGEIAYSDPANTGHDASKGQDSDNSSFGDALGDAEGVVTFVLFICAVLALCAALLFIAVYYYYDLSPSIVRAYAAHSLRQAPEDHPHQRQPPRTTDEHQPNNCYAVHTSPIKTTCSSAKLHISQNTRTKS